MKGAYPVIFTDVDTPRLRRAEPSAGRRRAEAAGHPQGLPPVCGPSGAAPPQGGQEGARHSARASEPNKPIPEPTPIADVDVTNGTFAEDGKGIVSLVDVDLTEYRRAIDNKMVRRNVTLPNWLNREAEEAHINVSGVLREALMSVLGVTKAR